MGIIKRADSGLLARDAIVLDLGDLHRQGEEIIARANARAERIVADAEAERERLLAGAAEEGHAAGFERGLAEGRAQGADEGRTAALDEQREQLTALGQRWEAAVEAFETEREALRTEARRDVLRLAVQIAERVTHRTIELHPGVAAEQLNAALGAVLHPTRMAARLNPEDLPLVEAALPAVLSRIGGAADVELVEDSSLSRGSCVLSRRASAGGDASDGPGGEVDARVETQLERLVEALLPGSAGPREGVAL